MSKKDEYAQAAFREIMSNRASGVYGSGSPGIGPGGRQEAPSSRGSDRVRSQSKVDGQAMRELQEVWASRSKQVELALINLWQNYDTMVEGFKILEGELQQTIGELSDCKEQLKTTEMVRNCVSVTHRISTSSRGVLISRGESYRL